MVITTKRVFSNRQNNLDQTALLYGVTIANGNSPFGSGMYNHNSSPTLINVTFSGNTADKEGGGMYNGGIQFDDISAVFPEPEKTKNILKKIYLKIFKLLQRI